MLKAKGYIIEYTDKDKNFEQKALTFQCGQWYRVGLFLKSRYIV
jgi:hypothetical protein